MNSPVPASDAQHHLALLGKATAAAKSGDQEQAITCLKEILDSAPLHEIANGMLASIYAELGLVDKAVYNFQQVLKGNPQNPLAQFQMGLVLLTAKRHQEALAAFQPMLEQKNEFLGHFHSGLALMSLNRPSEARPLLLEANKYMPASHPLHQNLQQLLSATE